MKNISEHVISNSCLRSWWAAAFARDSDICASAELSPAVAVEWGWASM